MKSLLLYKIDRNILKGNIYSFLKASFGQTLIGDRITVYGKPYYKSLTVYLIQSLMTLLGFSVKKKDHTRPNRSLLKSLEDCSRVFMAQMLTQSRNLKLGQILNAFVGLRPTQPLKGLNRSFVSLKNEC